MKTIPISQMVMHYVNMGFTVCYIDQDDLRSQEVLDLVEQNRVKDWVAVINGQPSGYGMPHYQVVIAVNEEEFHPMIQKEWVMIAGVFMGYKPLIIRVSI